MLEAMLIIILLVLFWPLWVALGMLAAVVLGIVLLLFLVVWLFEENPQFMGLLALTIVGAALTIAAAYFMVWIKNEVKRYWLLYKTRGSETK